MVESMNIFSSTEVPEKFTRPLRDVPRRYVMADWYGYRDTQVISELLRSEYRAGATLLDPFSGRGQIPFEASLAGFAATGLEIDPFACTMARLICDIPGSLDRVPNAMGRLEYSTRATRKYLFSTLCPQCGKESEVMAYRHVSGKPVESKYSCSSCKSAGIAEYGDFDLYKEDVIEKMELPLTELVLPDHVASLFSRRTFLALQVLRHGICRRDYMAHRRVLGLALAYTAAMCAELGNSGKSDFLHLNPFQFFPINVRKIIDGTAEASRAVRDSSSTVKQGKIEIIEKSSFTSVGSLGTFSVIATAPPCPGESPASQYGCVVDEFLALCPLTGDIKRTNRPASSQGRGELKAQDCLILPSEGPASGELRNRMTWLFGELNRKLISGGSVLLFLRSRDSGTWVEKLYTQAMENTGFRDIGRTVINRDMGLVIDQFTLGERPGPGAGGTLILRGRR
ncbi:MAG: hypothetical protein CVV64_03455 [Candidatus Wallbacteria bacterium HGW-Wallbacteria-1]|jgi:transposase-like protein|uniref:DNA methylase N-4/N-6 domain-containing protein n=1 Tax=Candidatus Wallbacteria bacterium HGW-Wallbacteria-1 TaxID=2013854 RepID=A0A2N1PTX8_9BACT|nr:MAG: hypothetical protein CVV64_03455 [Candidatus Wallbacteria bacterium HGW-Wallbacteria-1]